MKNTKILVAYALGLIMATSVPAVSANAEVNTVSEIQASARSVEGVKFKDFIGHDTLSFPGIFSPFYINNNAIFSLGFGYDTLYFDPSNLDVVVTDTEVAPNSLTSSNVKFYLSYNSNGSNDDYSCVLGSNLFSLPFDKSEWISNFKDYGKVSLKFNGDSVASGTQYYVWYRYKNADSNFTEFLKCGEGILVDKDSPVFDSNVDLKLEGNTLTASVATSDSVSGMMSVYAKISCLDGSEMTIEGSPYFVNDSYSYSFNNVLADLSSDSLKDFTVEFFAKDLVGNEVKVNSYTFRDGLLVTDDVVDVPPVDLPEDVEPPTGEEGDNTVDTPVETPDDEGTTETPDDEGTTETPGEDGDSVETPDDEGTVETPDEDAPVETPDDEENQNPDEDDSNGDVVNPGEDNSNGESQKPGEDNPSMDEENGDNADENNKPSGDDPVTPPSKEDEEDSDDSDNIDGDKEEGSDESDKTESDKTESDKTESNDDNVTKFDQEDDISDLEKPTLPQTGGVDSNGILALGTVISSLGFALTRKKK